MNRKQKALKELYKVGTVFVYTEELYEELSKLYKIKHIKAGVCQIVAEKQKGGETMERELKIKVNSSFESCDDCIHSNDTEEICKMRGCIHAIAKKRHQRLLSAKGKQENSKRVSKGNDKRRAYQRNIKSIFKKGKLNNEIRIY